MSRNDPILAKHIARFMQLAPAEYERCYKFDFRVILAAAKPTTVSELSTALKVHKTIVQKKLNQLKSWGLVNVVGETKSKTKPATLYQSVNPAEFAEKRRCQINAANPFQLTPALIAERNRYLEEEETV